MARIRTPTPQNPTREKVATAEDSALFHAAVSDVRRLRSEAPLIIRKPQPKAMPRKHVAAAAALELCEPSVAELVVTEHLEFKRNGVQPALWRRLRRGEFPLEESLDLHGCTIAEARDRLAEFLHACVVEGCKCVRIVHGKGFRTPAQAPVLKPRVAFWLAHTDSVVAYVSARPSDGGTGALYVLLKRRLDSAI
jgi:DNA-nicking Smr family endonuclease